MVDQLPVKNWGTRPHLVHISSWWKVAELSSRCALLRGNKVSILPHSPPLPNVSQLVPFTHLCLPLACVLL